MCSRRTSRALSELLLVGRDVVLRNFLDRVRIRNLVDHEHRPCREHRALDLFLADPDEVVGGNAMRLVDRSLVALVAQRNLRQYARASDASHEHGIGLGTDKL